MAKIDQVGGTHYSDSEGVCPHCGGAIQHWDWACKLPYLAGCVTKYVARFLSKDGFEGLKKAISYIEKMMSVYYPTEYARWKEHDAYPPPLRGIYSAAAPSGVCTLCGMPFAAHYASYACPMTAAPVSPTWVARSTSAEIKRTEDGCWECNAAPGEFHSQACSRAL